MRPLYLVGLLGTSLQIGGLIWAHRSGRYPPRTAFGWAVFTTAQIGLMFCLAITAGLVGSMLFGSPR